MTDYTVPGGVAARARLRAVAHRLVGRINGKFGSPTYTPIHYLDQSIDFDEMVARHRLAHVSSNLPESLSLRPSGLDPDPLTLSPSDPLTV